MSGMQGIPDSHLYRVPNTLYRIGTVFSPDDGHIFARNMSDGHLYRVTNTRNRIGTVFYPDDGHIVARTM
jgi:hypothetical protein